MLNFLTAPPWVLTFIFVFLFFYNLSWKNFYKQVFILFEFQSLSIQLHWNEQTSKSASLLFRGQMEIWAFVQRLIRRYIDTSSWHRYFYIKVHVPVPNKTKANKSEESRRFAGAKANNDSRLYSRVNPTINILTSGTNNNTVMKSTSANKSRPVTKRNGYISNIVGIRWRSNK